jgi:GDPmannose 4,6-dehydratase
MKKSLIFGCFGQDSWFLSNLLIKRGDQVTGCHRHTYLSDQFKDFQLDKMDMLSCDMMDRQAIDSIINQVKPDEVYNLAAHSFVGDSFKKPAQVINNNVISHINLLESIRANSPKTKLYYAGSSEEFNISSPYGVSKDAIRKLNDIYRESYGLFICHAQNFNHTSWRHSPQFFVPKVCKYVANLHRWLQYYKIISTAGTLIQGQCVYGNANFSWLPKLEVGLLSGYRDILYAEDVMEAAIIMMAQEKSGVYEVASGELQNMYAVLEYAFGAVKMDYDLFIVQKDDLFRPPSSETCPPVCLSNKLRSLGWEPSLNTKALIGSMVIEYLARGIK